jgi:hypothetical protein
LVSDLYCKRSDLYKYGLPRGMIANPGRLCASVLAATNTFELDGHGFGTDDALIVRAEAGGNVPAPLVANATVYAIPINEQTFKVAAAASGPPIDLTTDGDQVVVATPLPFDEVIEFYSRFADACMPNVVPLDNTKPYPILVVATVAELAARKLLLLSGQTSVSMSELELSTKAQLERWSSGGTIRDPNVTHSTNLAYSESVPRDVRGWNPPGRSKETLP